MPSVVPHLGAKRCYEVLRGATQCYEVLEGDIMSVNLGMHENQYMSGFNVTAVMFNSTGTHVTAHANICLYTWAASCAWLRSVRRRVFCCSRALTRSIRSLFSAALAAKSATFGGDGVAAGPLGEGKE